MKMTTFQKIDAELKEFAIAENIPILEKYFQVFQGGYGFGDQFYGVKVPLQRRICKDYYATSSWEDVEQLMTSCLHEHRMCAVYILIHWFEKTKSADQKNKIIQFYLHHIDAMNNWDLVDSSAYKLLGSYCRSLNHYDWIMDLAYQPNFWNVRVALVSTLDLIKHQKFDLSFQLCLLHAQHNELMIQKAIGWMLKEIGKKDKNLLMDFLDSKRKLFKPQTLRIATEKLSLNEKGSYFG